MFTPAVDGGIGRCRSKAPEGELIAPLSLDEDDSGGVAIEVFDRRHKLRPKPHPGTHVFGGLLLFGFVVVVPFVAIFVATFRCVIVIIKLC